MNDKHTNPLNLAEETSSKPSEQLCRSVRVKSWDEAKRIGNGLTYSVFRGQEHDSWGLRTKLERLIERYECDQVCGGAETAEREILETFQRGAHRYISHPPPLENKLEWLALIQHYGGPTRLLDFTRSFYVAAFFALENAENDAAIWAIETQSLQRKLDERLGSRHDALELPIFHKFYSDYCGRIVGKTSDGQIENAFVIPVEPWRMDERVDIQQSLFMFPTDIRISFEENLVKAFGQDDFLRTASIQKITLPMKIRYDALKDLNTMNINAATLFPGLDGFARSLQYRIALYDFKAILESQGN